MIIAVDFDGTCVTHEYPMVGKNIGAVSVLQQIVNKGHKLILYTMRSGIQLEDAINWFKENNIELWGINTNPEQTSWTTSPKCYAQIYIDDAAIGSPLIYHGKETIRPYIDWKEVMRILKGNGVL